MLALADAASTAGLFLAAAQPMGIVVAVLAGVAGMLYEDYENGNPTYNFTRATLNHALDARAWQNLRRHPLFSERAQAAQDECQQIMGDAKAFYFFEPEFVEVDRIPSPEIFLKDRECKLIDRMIKHERFEELGLLVGLNPGDVKKVLTEAHRWS